MGQSIPFGKMLGAALLAVLAVVALLAGRPARAAVRYVDPPDQVITNAGLVLALGDSVNAG